MDRSRSPDHYVSRVCGPLTSGSRQKILNAYAAIRKDFPSYIIDQCVTQTAKMLFVSKATVYRIKADQELRPNSSTSLLSTPGKKKPALSRAKTLELDHFDLEVIRRIIHTDFFKEKPTSYSAKGTYSIGHLYYNFHNIYIFI
ncbi:hypothetical protein C0J52_28335 [Blattella germanica]|nr:hypothetical protein C0J52_28335 [Blattella germanica]